MVGCEDLSLRNRKSEFGNLELEVGGWGQWAVGGNILVSICGADDEGGNNYFKVFAVTPDYLSSSYRA